jgi:hypothetical protein
MGGKASSNHQSKSSPPPFLLPLFLLLQAALFLTLYFALPLFLFSFSLPQSFSQAYFILCLSLWVYLSFYLFLYFHSASIFPFTIPIFHSVSIFLSTSLTLRSFSFTLCLFVYFSLLFTFSCGTSQLTLSFTLFHLSFAMPYIISVITFLSLWFYCSYFLCLSLFTLIFSPSAFTLIFLHL